MLPKNICVLDIETEVTNFKNPETSKLAFVGTRVYTLRNKSYSPGRHTCYLPGQITKLEKFLRTFEGIIIGHNIFQFDYRVLCPLISLVGIIEKTVDTLALLYRKNRKHVNGLSLDNLCRLNLGMGKTIHGEFISKLWTKGNKKRLIGYNKNDCVLTKELWWQLVSNRFIQTRFFDKSASLHVEKRIYFSDRDMEALIGKKPLFSFHSWKRKIEQDGFILQKYKPKVHKSVPEFDMSGHIPFDKCPNCGSRDLQKIDEFTEGVGIEGMTEGQLAEYMAGTWGTVECVNCGPVDYTV